MAELRTLVDLHSDLMSGMQETETMEGRGKKVAGAALKATGFVGANRRINMAIALGMSRSNLRMMIDAIAQNKGGVFRKLWGQDAAWAKRYLKKELGFSDKDVTRMVAEGPSKADMSRAIGKQIELVNAINESPASRPHYVAHPLWRIFFAYSTYIRKFARTMEYVAREAKNKNVRPLAAMLTTGVITGELIIALRDFLKDREREDENWLERLIDDFMEVGTFGLWGNLQYWSRHRGEYGHDFFGDVFSPPHLDFLRNLWNGVGDSINEKDVAPFLKHMRRSASALDIAAKQAEKSLGSKEARRDQLIKRLNYKVYIRGGTRKDGTKYGPLTPIPSKHKDKTTTMVLKRLREDHKLSDKTILARLKVHRRKEKAKKQ